MMLNILGKQGLEFDDCRKIIVCKERNRSYTAFNN